MPSFTDANVVPNVARALLGLLIERGQSAERVCRGLGFSPRDLVDINVRLSYRQTRLLITRSQRALRDPALGLSAGARQSPLAWGIAGLAMLVSETLGDAITYGLKHQGESGALLEHYATTQRGEMVVEVKPKVFDLEIEPFLVEEAFSSAVAVVRCLVGQGYKPDRIELAYPRPAHADAYSRFFLCPVHFSTNANRMFSNSVWLKTRLPGYDETTCSPLRAELNGLLKPPTSRNDLLESLSSSLRLGVDERPALHAVAQQLNMSERTLRRRLVEMKVSYRQLLDDVRHERARDMLSSTSLTVREVAQAVGFADARSFRRAFKRWTGALPGESR
nr:AraC family transcriptional regulator [uncultured Albidiferax sp.]